jgi:hypothetical protein
MEFNVFIRTLNKTYELDVMPNYTIFQVKKYISKLLKYNDIDFILYYKNKEIKFGTVEINNIIEDCILYVYPKINTGSSKNINNKNKIVYSTIDEVKDFIKKYIDKK